MRVFISHSSKDKPDYIRYIVDALGRDKVVYDEFNFEEGKKTVDEIVDWLGKSGLFVVVLSENSLSSPWVQKELKLAEKLTEIKKIRMVFPIISDGSITHADPRIPEWLRDYNIRHITRPSIAFRRIVLQLRLLLWEDNPDLRARETLFVGRNELQKQVEDRFSALDKPQPAFVIASGLSEVGRKKILLETLRKMSFVKLHYNPVLIELSNNDGIEDLYLKLMSTDLFEDADSTAFLSSSQDAKVESLKSLLEQLLELKEIVFLTDNGCIVKDNGLLASWFFQLLAKCSFDQTVLCIAAKTVLRPFGNASTNVFSVVVPELTYEERINLFKQYSRLLGRVLTNDEIANFKDIFSGLPGQVFFVSDFIEKNGLSAAIKNSSELARYNFDRSYYILNDIRNFPKQEQVLAFISSYDIVSIELLEKVFSGVEIFPILEDLVYKTYVNFIGSDKEYLSANAIVRDVIQRSKIPVDKEHTDALESISRDYLRQDPNITYDVSEYFIVMQELVAGGADLPENYLIPSHYINVLARLYNHEKKYADVITIAKRVLEKGLFLSNEAEQEVLYFLCLSLARTKNAELSTYIVRISDDITRQFVDGFSLRSSGKYEKAAEVFLRILGRTPHQRARRELVNVYNFLEEYDKAFSYAKANFEQQQWNPYHIQSYLHALINVSSDHVLVEKLLDRLQQIGNETSLQMFYNMKAEYERHERRHVDARATINEGLSQFPHSPYLQLQKIDNSIHDKSWDEASHLLERYGSKDRDSQFYNQFVLRKALLERGRNGVSAGIAVLSSELHRPGDVLRAKYTSRVQH